jgi:alkylated DNA repair dioxygenase AlkB
MMMKSQLLHQLENEALILFSGWAESWMSKENLSEFLDRDGIKLIQNRITVFGKEYNEPRLTQWMGPTYQYSNIHWPAAVLSPTLKEWADALAVLLGFSFNSVLINFYRNGNDSMGKHRDNEPEMDTRCIASLSFGTSREIYFEHIQRKEKIKITLHHGDLLVMKNMQQNWWHSIPKRKKIETERLNLTFRKIIL